MAHGKRWHGLALLLAILLTALLVDTGSVPTSALAQGAAPNEFQTKARQAILMDAETGAVLFQVNPDQQMSPASMSKLMTLQLVFKALQTGEVKGEDEFVMSPHAWRTGGAVSQTSAMMVPVNQRAKVSELLLGVIVQSGNDAAIALAEGLAGTEQEFAKLMTEEGRRLGLTNSTFRNATGLFHPEHLTTARDLATLSRHLIKTYPELYQLFATREFRYRTHRFFNRNPLLGADIGVDGLKTGYIKEAGYGIVASAKQGDRRLIAVVNGLTTANDRRDEARRLLEWGFKGFAEFKLFDPGEVVAHARVYGGDRLYVPVHRPGGVAVILPRFPANQRLRADLIYASPLKAPIRKGDPVAKLRVTSSTNAVNELQLVAAEDVEDGGLVRRGLDSLAHLATGWLK